MVQNRSNTLGSTMLFSCFAYQSIRHRVDGEVVAREVWNRLL